MKTVYILIGMIIMAAATPGFAITNGYFDAVPDYPGHVPSWYAPAGGLNATSWVVCDDGLMVWTHSTDTYWLYSEDYLVAGRYIVSLCFRQHAGDNVSIAVGVRESVKALWQGTDEWTTHTTAIDTDGGQFTIGATGSSIGERAWISYVAVTAVPEPASIVIIFVFSCLLAIIKKSALTSALE